MRDMIASQPAGDRFFIRRRTSRGPGHRALGLVHGQGRTAAAEKDNPLSEAPRPRRHPARCGHAQARQPMVHYTFQSLSQYLEKLHRYAEWGASDLWRKGSSRKSRASCCGRHRGSSGCTGSGRVSSTASRPRPVRPPVLRRFLKWAKLWEWRRIEKRSEKMPLPSFDGPRRPRDTASHEPSAAR